VTEPSARAKLAESLLALQHGDPYAEVIREAEIHRESHGAACGLYPAGPHVMRLAAALVRASRPARLLDLGAGFGYSSFWLARAAGPEARLEAIDRFPEHVARARAFAAQFGFATTISFSAGDVGEVLAQRDGRYDFIHDDAWFASAPPHYERVVALLRPGGTLSMPNWFLLEDAITGAPRRDWSEFAGPTWAGDTLAYAGKLSRDPRLDVTWSLDPPLGIAVKL
jgi:predicted O-methyltransferase YrrM